MKKVLEIHQEGYNCAESIVKSVNEEKGLNIPVQVASPFGGGMSVGGTCGAVTGSLMAFGAAKGRDSRKLSRELINKVKEKYGTIQCIELKKKGVSCDEIIEYCYDILEKNI